MEGSLLQGPCGNQFKTQSIVAVIHEAGLWIIFLKAIISLVFMSFFINFMSVNVVGQNEMQVKMKFLILYPNYSWIMIN